jgi:hypothetical protein
VVGGGPRLFDGKTLPYSNAQFKCSTLLFVLQYVPNPAELMAEVKRVSGSRIIIMQTVYKGRLGYGLLWFQEFFTSRLPFQLARAFRLIPDVSCTLSPRKLFSQTDFRNLVNAAGLDVVSVESIGRPGLFLRHELYVTEVIADKTAAAINPRS